MEGVLVRVGVDHAHGGSNAPVEPEAREFAYVPIPDGTQRPGSETPYEQVVGAVARFPGVHLPANPIIRAMHLDPDFDHLTYGENGSRRGESVAALDRGDFIAVFATLRPTSRASRT